MNQMISVCITPEQHQDLLTMKMMDDVNTHHRESQTRKKEHRYRRYIRAHDRRAKHLAYIRRRNTALAAALAGLLCVVTSATGLSWQPLFLPIGVVCVMLAAVLAGMLVQERKVAKK